MLRRLALLVSVVVAFGSLPMACSTTDEPLGVVGSTCDDDLQCAKPYVCACVQIRGTGDDGNDEIVKNGTCQSPGFLCVSDDAGNDVFTFDTASHDTGTTDSAGDGGGDGSKSDASSDASFDTSSDALSPDDGAASDGPSDAAGDATSEIGTDEDAGG